MAHTLHRNQKSPANDIQGWIASLINIVMAQDGAGSAMVTAVAAATNIATLRSGIEALSVHKKNKDWLRQLSHALQFAHDMNLFGSSVSASNTAIAALTTVNTVSATTDLLYLLCGQDNSEHTSSYVGFHAPLPSLR